MRRSGGCNQVQYKTENGCGGSKGTLQLQAHNVMTCEFVLRFSVLAGLISTEESNANHRLVDLCVARLVRTTTKINPKTTVQIWVPAPRYRGYR
jgi:hypothetical protein